MVDPDVQNSANCTLSSLSESSTTMRDVLTSHELYEAFARNIHKFMEKRGFASVRQLALMAGVAPNSLGNWLNLPSKDPTKTKTYPQLDSIEQVAEKLNCEVWELFHPDVEKLNKDLEALKGYREASKQDPKGS